MAAGGEGTSAARPSQRRGEEEEGRKGKRRRKGKGGMGREWRFLGGPSARFTLSPRVTSLP